MRAHCNGELMRIMAVSDNDLRYCFYNYEPYSREVHLSWEMYYEKNKGRPLRPLFLKALQYITPSANRAVDLGCGVGTEVSDLLQRGFEVHAVDQEAKSIELVKLNSANSSKLHTHLSSLEKWTAWPCVDFLFSYHSLPFCEPNKFYTVIEKALSSLNR